MVPFFDRKTVVIQKEGDGDFKEYFAMLEAHEIPHQGTLPVNPTGDAKHDKFLSWYASQKSHTSYFFNEEWRKENLAEIIHLYPIVSRLNTIEMVPQLDGCTTEQTLKIHGALVSVYDLFMGDVACSNKTEEGFDVKEEHFDILYGLAFNTELHLTITDEKSRNESEYVYKMKKVIKGAKKGGEALHNDNLPFKEAYRIARDAEQNKGKTRADIINLVDMGFVAPPSSIQTWAKQADIEDGFKRKSGRPPKKKDSQAP